IDQRADGRILLILDQRRVVVGAHQPAAVAEDLQQLAVIDVEAQGAGGGVEVGTVDEEGEALFGVEMIFHRDNPYESRGAVILGWLAHLKFGPPTIGNNANYHGVYVSQPRAARY